MLEILNGYMNYIILIPLVVVGVYLFRISKLWNDAYKEDHK